MSWTEITRPQYRRDHLSCSSDLTDEEWAPISPHMLEPKRLGRLREMDLRAVVNARLSVLATGCQWRLQPKDFSPSGQSNFCA